MAGEEKKSLDTPDWKTKFDEAIEDIKKRLGESANLLTFFKEEFNKIYSTKSVLSRELQLDDVAKTNAWAYFDKQFNINIGNYLNQLGYSKAFVDIFIKCEGNINAAYGAALAESNTLNDPILQELEKAGLTSTSMAINGLRSVGLPIQKKHVEILLEKTEKTQTVQNEKTKEAKKSMKKSVQVGVLESLASIVSDDPGIGQAHSKICRQLAKTYKLSPEQKIKLANKLGDMEWGINLLKNNKETRNFKDITLVAKLTTSPLVNEKQLDTLTKIVKKTIKKDKGDASDFMRNNIITNIIAGYVHIGNAEKIQTLATWYPENLATQYINTNSSLALFKAIESGNLETVQTLVSLGANVNVIKDSEKTGKNFPLKAAFESGHDKIFNYLADVGAVCRVKKGNDDVQEKLLKHYHKNSKTQSLADKVNKMLNNVSKKLDSLDEGLDDQEIAEIKRDNPDAIQSKALLPVYIEAAKEVAAKTPEKEKEPKENKRAKLRKRLSHWNVRAQPKTGMEHEQQSTLLPQEQDIDSLSVTITAQICESLPKADEKQVNALQGIIVKRLSACGITTIEEQSIDKLAYYLQDQITYDDNGIDFKKTKQQLNEMFTRESLAEAFGDNINITYKEEKSKEETKQAPSPMKLTNEQANQSLQNLHKTESSAKITQSSSQSFSEKHPRKDFIPGEKPTERPGRRHQDLIASKRNKKDVDPFEKS